MEYQLFKWRYRVPLAAGVVILLAGIAMNHLGHLGVGIDEDSGKQQEISGTHAIIMGSILVLISLVYRAKLKKEVARRG